MLLELIDPVVLELFKRLLVRAVVSEADSARALIVNIGDAAELFTARSVPNLQPHLGCCGHASRLHFLDLGDVVAADCWLQLHLLDFERGRVILAYEAGFADTGLPNDHYLVVIRHFY